MTIAPSSEVHLREIGVAEPLWWVYRTTARDGRVEFEGDVFWSREKAAAFFWAAQKSEAGTRPARGEGFMTDEQIQAAIKCLREDLARPHKPYTNQTIVNDDDLSRVLDYLEEMKNAEAYSRRLMIALRRSFKKWPAMPDPVALKLLPHADSSDDGVRGKSIQREFGLTLVPPVSECEWGAGFWDRITNGAWRTVPPASVKQ